MKILSTLKSKIKGSNPNTIIQPVDITKTTSVIRKYQSKGVGSHKGSGANRVLSLYRVSGNEHLTIPQTLAILNEGLSPKDSKYVTYWSVASFRKRARQQGLAFGYDRGMSLNAKGVRHSMFFGSADVTFQEAA